MADTTTEMTFDQLLTHAYGEIKKAIADEANVAKARMAHLKKEIDRIAKLSFEDVESEKVQVTVFQEPRTVAADETEREMSPQAAGAGGSSSSVTMNPEDMTKLDEVSKKVDELLNKTRADLEKAAGGDEWPQDMNEQRFEDGEFVPADDPSWGWDPADRQSQP